MNNSVDSKPSSHVSSYLLEEHEKVGDTFSCCVKSNSLASMGEDADKDNDASTILQEGAHALNQDDNEASVLVVTENPVKAYLKGVVSELALYFSRFDGTTTILSECPDAELETAWVEVPAGAEEFSCPWFGIAMALVRAVLRKDTESKKKLRVLKPLPIAHKEAREFFVSNLNSIVVDTLRKAPYGSLSVNHFQYLPEMEAISKRTMDERLALSSEQDSKSAVVTLQELESILIDDAGAWIASFFPSFQHLARNPDSILKPIWLNDTVAQLDIKELCHHVYTLCVVRNLLKNEHGLARGVVVPKTWLARFLQWLVSSLKQGVGEKSEHVIPGPIDAFSLVQVAFRNPTKHWLLAKRRDTVDVIPERFYNFLNQLFGTGPKYMMYGDFTQWNNFVDALKPRCLVIDVDFCWHEENDGVMEEKSVRVFVENAVYRTDLAEVLRLAFHLAQQEEDAFTEVQRQWWGAAVCCPSTLVIRAKEFQCHFFRPPLQLPDRASSLSVSELIEMMTRHLDKVAGASATGNESFSIELTMRKAAVEPQEDTQPCVTQRIIDRRGVCGLTNVGNTCYMNSALQCLSNFTSFREHILSFPVSRYPDAMITACFVSLLSSMWSGQFDFVKTAVLKNAIGQKVKRFAGYQQQDANEFIEVLLDQMQEEINEVSGRCYRERLDSDKNIPLLQLSELFWNNFLENNTSFMPRYFFYQSRTVFTCLACQETSTVFDNNITLSLNIRELTTVSVIVLVQKPPHRDMVEPTELESPAGATFYNPHSEVVHVYMDVRVADTRIRSAMERDVKKAIHKRLLNSMELKQKMISDVSPPTEGQEAQPIQLEYEVRMLEIPEGCSDSVHAWARCTMSRKARCHNDADCVKQQSKTALPVSSPTEGYRVWYFLKESEGLAHTAYGTLVYVEDLPPILPLIRGDYTSLNTTSAATQYKGGDDAADLDEEGAALGKSAAPAPSQPSPFSDHIINRGKQIIQYLLKPRAEVNDDLSSLTLGTSLRRFTASATDSPLEQQLPDIEPEKVPLQILHRASQKKPLLNIPASSRLEGDAWLKEYSASLEKQSHDDEGDGRLPSGCAGACNTTHDGVISISVFLVFQGWRFNMKQLNMVNDQSRLNVCRRWMSNPGNADADEDPVCTLSECLERAILPDTLTGDDSWYCPHCKEFHKASVQRSLFRLPSCLIISFKRFKVINAYHADKNNTLVDFPIYLDLSPYLDKSALLLQQGTAYCLRSIVYHSGSLSFGHYTACVFNDHLKKWVHFNDAHAFIDSIEKPPPHDAYILCYERCSLKE